MTYADGFNGTMIFDSKTQGNPYHLAILAAATLIENRMPEGKAFVVRDIRIAQADMQATIIRYYP